MPDLGLIALVVAFVAALFGIAASSWAAGKSDWRLWLQDAMPCTW